MAITQPGQDFYNGPGKREDQSEALNPITAERADVVLQGKMADVEKGLLER